VKGRAAALFAATAIALAGCGSDDDTSQNQPLPAATDPAPRLEGIPQRATSLGRANAPVTLVQFTDFRCERCAQYEFNVFPTLVDRYVRAGRLRLELRVIGLGGERSLEAAAWAAAAARRDRLYRFVDALFRADPDRGEVSARRAAADAGLPVDRVRRTARSGRLRSALRRTTEQARDAGIEAPAFYIARGRGAQQPLPVESITPEAFTEPIDRLLAGG
jgi:protein-disulfide isomerase